MKLEMINIADIDFDDNYFKISKKNVSEELVKSISLFGVFFPPVLILKNNKYKIFTGFNRTIILKNNDAKNVEAFVIDKANGDLFFKYGMEKNLNKLLGPMGKIKFIQLLKDEFNFNEKMVDEILTKGLNIKRNFINDIAVIKKIDMLPNELKLYIDDKDITFKIINKILHLPDRGIILINKWLRNGMRVNIFKLVVEYIADIYKRDKNLDELADINIDELNQKDGEDKIFNFLFKIRYPEFSVLKKRSDEILLNFKSKGIIIDFPKYFEGDSLNITFKIQKGDNSFNLSDKLEEVDYKKIDELMKYI